jgi:phosphohistidine phosphatase
MKLLVIRHAIAEERADFARTGQHDDLRPLTAKGRRRMHRVANGLRLRVPDVRLLATSPLVRAVETADILAPVYPEAEREEVEELAPDHELPAFLRWLRERGEGDPIAVVGHEPHLSHLVSWLLAGRFTSFVQLKKGAACLLTFLGEPAPGEARLLWLLQPVDLQRTGSRR